MNLIKKQLQYLPLAAALIIPLNKKAGWTTTSFGKTPVNIVSYSEKGLTIAVHKSASPLIYKLARIEKITGFEVLLHIEGGLQGTSGEKNFDEDSIFRLGLVTPGSTKLNALRRMMAPSWIKTLFALVPSGIGIDKIYFFNVGKPPQTVGAMRLYPKSDLIHEEIVALRNPLDKDMKISKHLTKPLDAAAIWLSIDGDDTQSDYKLQVEQITLFTD
jgi:hypothetical protein